MGHQVHIRHYSLFAQIGLTPPFCCFSRFMNSIAATSTRRVVNRPRHLGVITSSSHSPPLIARISSCPSINTSPGHGSKKAGSKNHTRSLNTTRLALPLRASYSLLSRSQPTTLITHRLPTSFTSIRHCSCRRRMCKLDVGEGAIETGLDASNGRELLPTNVKPVHYTLTLEPNFEDFSFEGKVIIEYGSSSL